MFRYVDSQSDQSTHSLTNSSTPGVHSRVRSIMKGSAKTTGSVIVIE